MRSARPLCVLLAATLAAGCEGASHFPVAPGNESPTIRITQSPIEPDATAGYRVTLRWSAWDPDGRVAHSLYAVDPPAHGDTAWVRTSAWELTRAFAATELEPPGPGGFRFESPHVFVVLAVDDHGARSAPEVRAFFSRTVAPDCWIVSPGPRPLDRAILRPSFTIEWAGDDPDGPGPTHYKWTTIDDRSAVPLRVALAHPDSVRRHWAPRGFAGWDSVPGDVREARFTGLEPGSEFLFVVVAFDEAGAYSPVFSRERNMLYGLITRAGAGSPRITIWNQYIHFEYPTGSWDPINDPPPTIEVPAGMPVEFNWSAEPRPSTTILGYRWMLDGDFLDPRPREHPDQYERWSARSLETHALLPGFDGDGGVHHFLLEAMDSDSVKSLVVIGIRALRI